LGSTLLYNLGLSLAFDAVYEEYSNIKRRISLYDGLLLRSLRKGLLVDIGGGISTHTSGSVVSLLQETAYLRLIVQ
jgi:hypothetical protein